MVQLSEAFKIAILNLLLQFFELPPVFSKSTHNRHNNLKKNKKRLHKKWQVKLKRERRHAKELHKDSGIDTHMYHSMRCILEDHNMIHNEKVSLWLFELCIVCMIYPSSSPNGFSASIDALEKMIHLGNQIGDDSNFITNFHRFISSIVESTNADPMLTWYEGINDEGDYYEFQDYNDNNKKDPMYYNAIMDAIKCFPKKHNKILTKFMTFIGSGGFPMSQLVLDSDAYYD